MARPRYRRLVRKEWHKRGKGSRAGRALGFKEKRRPRSSQEMACDWAAEAGGWFRAAVHWCTPAQYNPYAGVSGRVVPVPYEAARDFLEAKNSRTSAKAPTASFCTQNSVHAPMKSPRTMACPTMAVQTRLSKETMGRRVFGGLHDLPTPTTHLLSVHSASRHRDDSRI